MSAAVVSPRFRRQLLSDPVSALAAGYNGERFNLTSEEMRLVCSIQATTLRGFAVQLMERMRDPYSESPCRCDMRSNGNGRYRLPVEHVPAPIAVGHD